MGMMVLAVFIALGKVEEKTSFGLTPLVTILGAFVFKFGEWAYTRRHDADDK